MDSHEKNSADVREVSPPPAEEPKVPSETSTNPVAADRDAKIPGDRTETDKKAGKEKSSSKKRSKNKQGKTNKKRAPGADSSDASDEDDPSCSSSASSDSDDSDSDSAETKNDKKQQSAKKRQDTQKSKRKTHATKKPKKVASQQSISSDSDSDSSDSEDDYDSEKEQLKEKHRDLAKQVQQDQKVQQELAKQVQLLQIQIQNQHAFPYANPALLQPNIGHFLNQTQQRVPPVPNRAKGTTTSGDSSRSDESGTAKQAAAAKGRVRTVKMDFKRVDQVWDNTIHNYKLQDTAEGTPDAQYDEFLFHVRRTFDWEGKFKATLVDIKSKYLRECLQEVIGNIKGVSLVEDTPKLDPNMLFLYLEDLRKHLKDLKKELKKQQKKPKGSARGKHDRKKEQKRIETKRQHLKVLLRYIDKDYAEVKNNLYPLLENGLITYDLLWALWKPNTLAFTTTYGSQDQPRVFKVEMAEKHYNLIKGDFYYIEGKYFEYDGKQFGFGSMSEEISDFRGARKITSLHTYPLKYHKNETQLRKELIERGKKFVSLSGVHYISHQGMAYYKKKKSVIKVNINGRIMIDPSIHRRINPNYPVSLVRPKDHDVIDDSDETDDDLGGGCEGLGDESDHGGENVEESKEKYVTTVVKDSKGNSRVVKIPKSEVEEEQGSEKLDQLPSKEGDDSSQKSSSNSSEPDDESEGSSKVLTREFSDEEYLIASPVVLGFAFAEKLWLEFTVSGVKDIQWNQNAYESLVLKPSTKDIVKALVESHKYHAAESIDDVIQGKGKGLVAVLHGPPGTGKTLTAEGISELLKCPLYMVSAGELGTDSRYLEGELQKILDICHAWGAILLLDEADVFLEKRNMHDIHRNALVSIFLRQLEYFQGILFLTTNRVETFDDAFQSRIHIALRYENLDQRARKAIFKIFVERVRVLEKVELNDFTEKDYDDLARHALNGRQIKNTVRTAQALAVNKREPLAMKHIQQVLGVQMDFDRDLRGGTGFEDAMRGYL